MTTKLSLGCAMTHTVRLFALSTIVTALIAGFCGLRAQTITLNDASTYTANRVGLNLGANNYFNSYLIKNRFAAVNGSLQPAFYGAIITASGGSTTTFTDPNTYSDYTADEFAGGTFQVMCHNANVNCTGGAGPSTYGINPSVGTNIGCHGTISSNTAAVAGSSGATFTISSACSAAIAANDTVYIHNAPTCGATFGWGSFGVGSTTSGTGEVGVDCTSANFPSGFQGIQVAQVGATSGSSSGAIWTYYDTTSGAANYYFNGTYSACIQASVLSGSGLTMSASLVRSDTSGGINTSASTSISGSGWQTYCVSLTGAETAVTGNNLVIETFTISGSGAFSVDVIAPSVVATADSSSSVLPAAALANIASWNPGECRYWYGNNSQNAESLNNWIAPDDGKYPVAVWGNFASGSVNEDMGLYNFLEAAHAAGCPQVTVVTPLSLTWNNDAANLSDFIFGGSGTTYGAKRIALGQTANFGTLFSRIILDYGNEVWNGAVASESIPLLTNWNYLGLVVQWCGAMKSAASWNSSVGKCGATLQTANEAYQVGQLASLDTNHYVDDVALNEYTQDNVTTCTNPDEWISAYVENGYQNNHDSSSQSGFYQAVTQANTDGYIPESYEFQNGTNGGSCTQAQMNGYPEGEGYAIADVLGPLEGNKVFGLVDTDFFTFYQPNFSWGSSAGTITTEIWGSWTGPGGQYQNARPSAYAADLTNNCIGTGTGYATSWASNPTFSFAGYNGVNSESAVPYLWSYAFKSGSTRCVEILNTNTSSGYAVTMTGTNPPSGSVTETTLSAAALTTNNESALNVTPSTSVVSNPSSFTVPAHSLMTISYSTGASPTLTSITISGLGGATSVYVASTLQIGAQCYYSDSTNDDCTTTDGHGNACGSWTSSVTGYGTISSGGLLTGVAAGTTDISCSIGAVDSNSLPITVEAAPPARPSLSGKISISDASIQ